MPLTEVHSQGVLLSQACNPHRRVAPTEHIFHKRAALTGVQPSQACSSHRVYISRACSSHRRVALHRAYISQACSSHRRGVAEVSVSMLSVLLVLRSHLTCAINITFGETFEMALRAILGRDILIPSITQPMSLWLPHPPKAPSG
jgi:hypothetical protein